MPIIEVKNIGKKYNISHRQGGYLTLRDVLTNVFSNPFRFLKQKAKVVAGLTKTEEFWALKDISFNVEKGEVIGIIGHNGAGKSTLLKILSQITPPTTGEIRIDGRVGSLLEVGTGFHPELTGRENIFLNGAILGMERSKIIEKFDEIVEFSGVEKFLDTPVKHYSSGMYVRLAFSVAAHMEPDVLIIDEVLAVGDAEFQKKCLGKMDEITKKEGRTILFVSHNLVAVQQICNKCLLLEEGKIVDYGSVEKMVTRYMNSDNSVRLYDDQIKKNAQITKISVLNSQKVASTQIGIDECFYIEVEYDVKQEINQAILALVLYSVSGELLFMTTENDRTGETRKYEVGKYKALVAIPSFLLNVGNYYFDISIQDPFVEYFDLKKNVNFAIINSNNPKNKILKGNNLGFISTILDYKLEKIK
ncbi:MAG: ABC transporter ATP-binding protein [Patescibacteria group bacterium]